MKMDLFMCVQKNVKRTKIQLRTNSTSPNLSSFITRGVTIVCSCTTLAILLHLVVLTCLDCGEKIYF